MKSKRILSLLLSLLMILSMSPMSVFATDPVYNVNANFTAQANGEFLCAPQIGVSVSSDIAENYGFNDSIKDGVSAIDALVKLHEIKYGSSFTKDNAYEYLTIDDSGYVSKLFAIETTANGFVYNGAYPNDGTESDWGGYNGTTVTTQKLSDGDTIEFFMYQDTYGWSDELTWFSYKGNAVTEITAAPKASLKLNLQTSSYMMAYQYINADAIHATGSAVSGAQLAWVDTNTGVLEDITSAITDTSGNTRITVPDAEGSYYLTAYIPDGTEGEPLIMSLTAIIVSKDAPQADPCALNTLSIASFDSNPNALKLTPAFHQSITEYSVPTVDFPAVDLGVFRSVYVKATAESDEAVITAACGNVNVNITSGDSNWTMLNGALTGGKNNVLQITVAASSDEAAERKTYFITIPMKPQTNTAPKALKEADAVSITVGDTYSIDLSEIFTDTDEVDILTYKVSVNDAEAVETGADYTFTPDEAGVYQFVFTANDGTEDSDSYTVSLTVNALNPHDTTKAIAPNGIVLSPTGRVLSSTAYKGISEGTMQKADESGILTSGTGVSSAQHYYRTFIYDDVESFRLNLASSTAYAHIRYSTDSGSTWTETAQGGGVTNEIAFSEHGTAEIMIQIIDDSAYAENIKAGKDGFYETEPAEYKVWIDRVHLSAPAMLTAEATGGDWYPAFSSDRYSYWLMVKNNAAAPTLTYTVADGNTVKIGTTDQTADENGKYTLTLTTAQTSITVTSKDGDFTNTYKFGYEEKSALDVPDKVVDYLCIGSQYTNTDTGIYPEATLCGGLKSLGNFGGYITYYYEDPILDNPNNKYGMDFYVIGNAFAETDSAAEPGQVYVSEDGNSWYALAGSEHYENTAIWDYTITYTKGTDGKAYWTDNYGNSIDYAAKTWPSTAYYYMNNTAKKDSYTFTGILLKSQLGSMIGDGTAAALAAKPKFGYADCYTSNISETTLTDINSYAENSSKANGFDVAWAVDENGIPVDVSDKAFHYVKVATASNIYAGGFGEKSTEVAYVVRTTAQDTEVGKTAAPTGVTISDGADSKTVNFAEGQNVYSVNLDNMKYVSVKVNGTAEDDNIYVNNQRIASSIAAEGFKVTKENGETKVRVIVQNGDKEPRIYLLRLTSNAEESNELVEGIKIDASGTVREATTKNGTDYTASVGYRISSIAITPVADRNVTIKVNGEALAASYDLAYGSNTFEIAATDEDGNNQTITLTVTRANAPTSTGKTITIKFALYGDEKHEDSEVHTYKNDKGKLPVWISQKSYTVDAGATVMDVFEKALKEAGLTWKSDGENYISEINGLAEFDNGPLSGWLYLLNGTRPLLGAAEQALKNGDLIVFHYTDDYTQERGSEQWVSSSSSGGGSAVYTVKFETNGGNTIKSQSLNKNATVTKPSDPTKDGYTFAGWYTDKELTKEYNFSEKVTSGFTLYAKWTESEKEAANNKNDKPLTAFADVEPGSWYEEAVVYATKKNLFKGVSDTEFAPNSEMTRAMLVTVLYRLENPKENEKTHRFADVADEAWYAEAVNWAAENGVINGVSETAFAPNDNITREQMAAIIYRYAKLKGYDTEEISELSDFTDTDKISPYALDAVKWANAAKLINGISETSISPKTTATRAQVAEILMRFGENVVK